MGSDQLVRTSVTDSLHDKVKNFTDMILTDELNAKK